MSEYAACVQITLKTGVLLLLFVYIKCYRISLVKW